MGGASGRFSRTHVLHYYKPDENRVYLFDTNYELLYCYPIYKDYHPFFFGKLQTINIPQRKCVFIIGGLEVKDSSNFAFIKPKPKNANELDDTKTACLKGI